MHRARNQALAVGLLASVLSGTPAVAGALQLLDEQGRSLSDVVVLVDGVPAGVSATAVMDQQDMQFQPRVLAVAAGTQVSFPNSDDVRHHVYSFSTAKAFELRLFKGTEAPPVRFEQAGPVIIGCNIHDSMVGYILVTDSPWYQVSDPAGRVTLEQLPSGSWPVSWWHPSLGEASPVALGELDLHGTGQLTLPVTVAPAVISAKPLSPLQQRFRKATEHNAH